MCARFLYAVLPSELYWGDQTLKYMNGFFADDLKKLYETGVQVSCLKWDPIPNSKNSDSPTLHPRLLAIASSCRVIGIKGDWPYLRKALGWEPNK